MYNRIVFFILIKYIFFFFSSFYYYLRSKVWSLRFSLLLQRIHNLDDFFIMLFASTEK